MESQVSVSCFSARFNFRGLVVRFHFVQLPFYSRISHFVYSVSGFQLYRFFKMDKNKRAKPKGGAEKDRERKRRRLEEEAAKVPKLLNLWSKPKQKTTTTELGMGSGSQTSEDTSIDSASDNSTSIERDCSTRVDDSLSSDVDGLNSVVVADRSVSTDSPVSISIEVDNSSASVTSDNSTSVWKDNAVSIEGDISSPDAVDNSGSVQVDNLGSVQVDNLGSVQVDNSGSVQVDNSGSVQVDNSGSVEVAALREYVPSASNDPAIFLSKRSSMTGEEKREFVRLGPHQPKCRPPKSIEKYYFERKNVGSSFILQQRQWLSYSLTLDKVFCVVCMVYGDPSDLNSLRDGFDN